MKNAAFAETLDEEEFSEDSSETEEGFGEIPLEKRVLQTQAYDKSVGDLMAMMDTTSRESDIRLDPHYQRSYVWDNKKASLLIESILLNVPIPVIYVEEDENGRWNVVDGLQRLIPIPNKIVNNMISTTSGDQRGQTSKRDRSD
jgi:Protein of unknown function DUF262